MNKRIKDYFQVRAEEFDAIYTGRKNRLMVWLDRFFRRDMQERFAETIAACGDVRGRGVLDIGCGSGRYAVALAKRGAVVTGIDCAGGMASLAKRIAEEEGMADRCSFVEGEFPSAAVGRVFDITLAIGFFDYFADPLPHLLEMRKVTEGRLIATFPRFWTWRAPVRKARLAILGCPVCFYTEKRVMTLLRKSGWWPVTVKRVGKLHFVVASPREQMYERGVS